MNQYKKELFEIIKKNRSLVMLAPSFPVDFEYPNVIGMLKKLLRLRDIRKLIM